MISSTCAAAAASAPWRPPWAPCWTSSPIITENRAGKLVSSDKVRGRKAALRLIADKAAENIDDPAQAMTIILHADAPEDAARLESMLRERVPALGEIQTYYVGPVIGAHCGPGTVAICFFGKERPC